MTLFEQILDELQILSESTEVNDINDAIKNLTTAKIRYNDGNDGERIICPVAYGMSTAGNPVVRAFQKSGPSENGWKLFNFTKIEDWENNESEKYDPDTLVGLNKEGDRQMSIIYTIAPIGSAKDIKIGKEKGMPDKLTSGPVSKKDVMTPANKPELPKVDNSNYNSNNAINDLLTGVGVNPEQDVDKEQNKDYISNKLMNAPETTPVSKGEIPGGDNKVGNSEDDNTNETKPAAITDDPVTKSDLEQKDEIKATFDNWMERMDNVNKNED